MRQVLKTFWDQPEYQPLPWGRSRRSWPRSV